MRLNNMTKDQFMREFGDVYESSPWVASRVWASLKKQPIDSKNDLIARMKREVDDASFDRKMALIRHHPELAGKAAIAGDITEVSKKEQSGAGLSECTPAEFEAFQRLNAEYNKLFGMPFIICVNGLGRSEILRRFEERVKNSVCAEYKTAISEIHKIAANRVFQKK